MSGLRPGDGRIIWHHVYVSLIFLLGICCGYCAR